MKKYPLDMIHPNAIKGSARPIGLPDAKGRQDFQGTPDILPPVTVTNEDQEDDHRARGYIVAGEQPSVAGYEEYPKWLSHPAKDAVLVTSSEDEQARIAEGYAAAGKPDPEAVAAAAAMPHVPGRVHSEFPKMVNGVLQDPEAARGSFQEYPKWVGNVLVNTAAEELALAPKASKPPKASKAVPAAL